MKRRFAPAALTAAFLTVTSVAFAHPGHDGPHDFEWDFDHLVEHPIATLACFAVIALAGWAVWRWSQVRRATVRTNDRRQ